MKQPPQWPWSLVWLGGALSGDAGPLAAGLGPLAGRSPTWWLSLLNLPSGILSSSHPLKCCGVWTQQPAATP